MAPVKKTDMAGVRRMTYEFIRRSGDMSSFSHAENAVYLHEFLEAVLRINPLLWLGEVIQFVSDADYHSLLRYAISLHLDEAEVRRVPDLALFRRECPPGAVSKPDSR